jgi:hypothetical protein
MLVTIMNMRVTTDPESNICSSFSIKKLASLHNHLQYNLQDVHLRVNKADVCLHEITIHIIEVMQWYTAAIRTKH